MNTYIVKRDHYTPFILRYFLALSVERSDNGLQYDVMIRLGWGYIKDTDSDSCQRENMAHYFLCCLLCILSISWLVPVKGYKDDIPLEKWSPVYFNKRFFPEPRLRLKRRMPSPVQV